MVQVLDSAARPVRSRSLLSRFSFASRSSRQMILRLVLVNNFNRKALLYYSDFFLRHLCVVISAMEVNITVSRGMMMGIYTDTCIDVHSFDAVRVQVSYDVGCTASKMHRAAIGDKDKYFLDPPRSFFCR